MPLAAALWQGGISFGGVVSFVFADLITLPLLSIYRKYFGAAHHAAAACRVLGDDERAPVSRWSTCSRRVGIPDAGPAATDRDTGFQWNYTTVLNLLAVLAFAGLYWLYRHRDVAAAARFAKDPVCGMQVEKRTRPRYRPGGRTSSTGSAPITASTGWWPTAPARRLQECTPGTRAIRRCTCDRHRP